MFSEINLAELTVTLVSAFTDPKKRIYWGYLLSAGVLGMFWLIWRMNYSFKSAWQRIADRQVWWSGSSRADYALWLINKLFFIALAPLLLTHLLVATWLFENLHLWLGSRPQLFAGWPIELVMLLFTFSYFLLDDLSRFYLHKLLHEVPALWLFHQVHHSARVLTPFTVFRTHPVEGVLFSLRATLVQGVMIGGGVFFLGDRADLVMVLGANIFVFVFNLLGSNLRHSHLPISYGQRVESVLISPAQHQIHHSADPKHFDKNYGVVLSVWDRLNGSLVYGQETQQLEYGISRRVQPDEHSLFTLYVGPLRALIYMLFNRNSGQKKGRQAMPDLK